MNDDTIELEMRIDGLDTEGGLRHAEEVLLSLDPDATLRLDPETGIAHLRTTRQALEIEDAMTRAGLQVTAATG
ncbi:hypothetical protein [uncultured Enterovirga sp.]|uniref:hypothetical protein n=1 Tax=uncultured Enterovirga sp. TaxID=2026352 RepID=UPI0035CBC7AA